MYAEAASAAGNLIGAGLNYAQGQQNAELQKQFAKQGIRWKVADAQAAGIHPLYALGAPTSSFSPVSIGDPGGGLSEAGQSIGSAIDATRTAPEKVDAYTNELRRLQLQKGGLENELLASQIAQMRQRGNAPPMASSGDPFLMTGQTSSGLKPPSGVVDQAMRRTIANPSAPNLEPGAITETGHLRTRTGWAPVPSNDAKNRIEDTWLPEMMWGIRNYVLPSLASSEMQPPFKAPAGMSWRYNILKQEYQLVRAGSSSSSPGYRSSTPRPGWGSGRNY